LGRYAVFLVSSMKGEERGGVCLRAFAYSCGVYLLRCLPLIVAFLRVLFGVRRVPYCVVSRLLPLRLYMYGSSYSSIF
jgi:hypothetical protein